ncbi:hypothetical protein HK100_012407 [Physocladia obscura]|uniref:Apple domain-containing protein n=1 Tax=Physocladia obscura TaxID=109957 RepID=A0AAD5XFX9_9FUNG|nr:hypothetical protein HK100_012407 [Physocladia obscura]
MILNAVLLFTASVMATRSMTLVNNCGTELTVSFTAGSTSSAIGSVNIGNGGSAAVSYPNGWSGNIHACPTSGVCGPVTLAEFTLNGGSIDTYDISVINGFNYPLEMRPVSPPLNANDPYTCGTPGAVSPNTATGSCAWTGTPPSQYFYAVGNVGASCTTSSQCSSGQVCGLNIATPLGRSLNCGTFAGYWGPEQTVTYLYGGSFSTSDPNFELFGCVGANSQSCYTAGASSSCCGCENWNALGITVPSNTAQCANSNPSWISTVLPTLEWMKESCPTAYTYPFDDKSSTFTCPSTVSYTVTWCPNGVTLNGSGSTSSGGGSTGSSGNGTPPSSNGFSFAAAGQIEWASGCDWTGGDIANELTTGELCGATCEGYSGCTRFTWTTYNGGTCWLKNNSAAGPISNSLSGTVCGYIV